MLESMRIRHHAFTGEQDTGIHLGTTLGWLQSKGAKEHPLRVYDVPGDHFESLAPACAAFFDLAEGRASPIAARSPESLDAAGRDPALALYQSETVLGEGPFGEPKLDSASSESQLLELEGWMLKIPAAATTKVLVPDWPKTVGFYTEDFGGSLTVAQIPPENQAGFRPLDAAYGALSNALTMMTPTGTNSTENIVYLADRSSRRNARASILAGDSDSRSPASMRSSSSRDARTDSAVAISTVTSVPSGASVGSDRTTAPPSIRPGFASMCQG